MTTSGKIPFDNYVKLPKRVLEPNERITEVLFGLIMVLTFTGSLSLQRFY
jgi:hypothetical protein